MRLSHEFSSQITKWNLLDINIHHTIHDWHVFYVQVNINIIYSATKSPKRKIIKILYLKLYIKNVDTGEAQENIIRNVSFSSSWKNLNIGQEMKYIKPWRSLVYKHFYRTTLQSNLRGLLQIKPAKIMAVLL